MKLTFDKQQLCYDVANACYVISRSIRASRQGSALESDGALEALVADVSDRGNRDILHRSLDKAFSDAAEAAGGWPANMNCDSDNSPLQGEYLLDVDLPESEGNAAAKRMIRLIHRYMVMHAVHDWLLLTAPALAGSSRFALDCDDLLESIRSLRVYGLRSARIIPRPF